MKRKQEICVQAQLHKMTKRHDCISLLMQKTCQRGSWFLHLEQNSEQQRRSFTDIFPLCLAAHHSYEQQERYHNPICWLFFGTTVRSSFS